MISERVNQTKREARPDRRSEIERHPGNLILPLAKSCVTAQRVLASRSPSRGPRALPPSASPSCHRVRYMGTSMVMRKARKTAMPMMATTRPSEPDRRTPAATGKGQSRPQGRLPPRSNFRWHGPDSWSSAPRTTSSTGPRRSAARPPRRRSKWCPRPPRRPAGAGRWPTARRSRARPRSPPTGRRQRSIARYRTSRSAGHPRAAETT